MADRGKTMESSRPEEGGQRETMRLAVLTMARFLLGFLMAAGRFAGTMAPFGTAIVAQAGTGLGGLATLAGACLGYLATGGLDWGIRYAAASVLAFTLSFIIGEERMATSPWIAPSAAFAVTAATGALGRLAGGMGDIGVAAEVLTESLISGAAAYFFREALERRERQTEGSERRHDAAVAVMAACALTAVARVEIAGAVSVGRVIALLLVMASSLKGGCMAGAAAGTAFGLAMDAAGGAEPFFTMAYAFAGLVSGVFARYGRLTFLIAFILADALCAACCWRWTQNVAALFEVFAASVVFMLIPPAALARISSLLQPMAPGMGESGLRRYAARRVEGIARAYGDVCEVVRRNTADSNDNDIARVFDRAADVSCIKCKKRNECWTKNYMETLDALNAATEAMTARGSLEEGDIPEWFRRKCLSLPAFVAAVNAELRSLAFRRQYRAQLAESRAAAWAQYEDFAEILAGVAREIGSVNGADPLAERRLMRYLRSLDIEADAAVFRDGGGRLRAVIESGRLGALTKDPA